MSTQLRCLLFLPLLGLVASLDDCQGTSTCESVRSWTAAAHEEDAQGLELLQKRGSKVDGQEDDDSHPHSSLTKKQKKEKAAAPHLKLAPLAEDNGCAVPRDTAFAMGGKKCPHQGACLAGNQAFTTLLTAWEACALNEFCGAVMQATDGHFYLRRESDPDDDSEKLKLYAYPCKKRAFQENAIKKKAEAKAKELVKEKDPLEEFKMKVEMHDVKKAAKAEVEKEKKEMDKKHAKLAKKEAAAKKHLKQVKMSTKDKLKAQEEEKKQLEAAKEEMRKAAQKAKREEEALQKLLNDQEQLRQDEVKEQKGAQRLAQAKQRLEVASEVAADAEKAEQKAEEEANKYTVTVPRKIKELEKQTKKDLVTEKQLKRLETVEEQSLSDLKEDVHMEQRELRKAQIEDGWVQHELHEYAAKQKAKGSSQEKAAEKEEENAEGHEAD